MYVMSSKDYYFTIGKKFFCLTIIMFETSVHFQNSLQRYCFFLIYAKKIVKKCLFITLRSKNTSLQPPKIFLRLHRAVPEETSKKSRTNLEPIPIEISARVNRANPETIPRHSRSNIGVVKSKVAQDLPDLRATE